MALVSILGVWRDGPKLDPAVPSNTSVQVDWPRGTDGSVELRLVDHDGQVVDLDIDGSDRVTLSVRSSVTGGFLKSWTGAKATDELGKYTFSIASADTIDFNGFLIFDVWATKAGAQRQVVAASYLRVLPRMPQ